MQTKSNQMISAPLAKLRIIEGSAFVAAPLGGLMLAQLGAEVIRFDPIGGGLDNRRWPITKDSKSLFWAGLNRGKKSLTVDLKTEKGRKLISDLITAPGDESGIFLTNLPAKDELSYEELRKKRSDLIMVLLTGNHDGTPEVDYTVHPAFGYPMITGPKDSRVPINSVLPTWDLLLGNMVAIAILAADRKRRMTGEGELIKIALSDVALSVVGALGRLSQAHLQEEVAAADGNFLYGAFGTNFVTADEQQVMLVGLTDRQWKSLKTALGIDDAISELATKFDTNLDDEGERYKYRYQIAELIAPIIGNLKFTELSMRLDQNKVSWSKYQTFTELLAKDPRASKANPIFNIAEQEGIGELPNIASPIRFANSENLGPLAAPQLGAHTIQVLREILKLDEGAIRDLIADRVINQ